MKESNEAISKEAELKENAAAENESKLSEEELEDVSGGCGGYRDVKTSLDIEFVGYVL